MRAKSVNPHITNPTATRHSPLSRSLAAAALLSAALLAFTAPASVWAAPKEAAKTADEHKKDAARYAKALKKNAKDRAAALGLAKAAIGAELSDEMLDARDALLEFLDANENDAAVRVALGNIALTRGRLTSDAGEKKWIYPDAEGHFQAALKSEPQNGEAVIGLARAFYNQAKFTEALATLDPYLAKQPEGAGEGFFLQGEIHYLTARDLHSQAGGGYPLPDNVAAAYRKAQGAYRAATMASPENAEAHMRLAYTSAPLGDLPTAEAAYLAIADLDPDNGRAIRGLHALYARTDLAKYTKLVEGIVAKNPGHPAATLALGADKVRKGDYSGANKLLTAGAKKAKFPTTHYYYLGQSAEKDGDPVRAKAFYMKSLEADPTNAMGAAGAERIVHAGRTLPGMARMSVDDAMKLVKAYDEILAVAKDSVDLRNNLGFILRETYVLNGQTPKYKPVLMASIKAYTEATDLIGEWDESYRRTMSFQQRYGYAQVISDTGLMFQFHKAAQDLEKAAMLYERALEFSEYGYFDAWNNYRKMLSEQGKYEDLYDLADACSEGLIQADGKPHQTGRAQARAVAQGLLDSGKVK